jgi:hypothetical protein
MSELTAKQQRLRAAILRNSTTLTATSPSTPVTNITDADGNKTVINWSNLQASNKPIISNDSTRKSNKQAKASKQKQNTSSSKTPQIDQPEPEGTHFSGSSFLNSPDASKVPPPNFDQDYLEFNGNNGSYVSIPSEFIPAASPVIIVKECSK